MPDIEFERYELTGGPAYRFSEVHRRDFLKRLGGGIAIFLALDLEGEAQESGSGGRRAGGRGDAMPKDLGAWLHIGENGAVSIFTGKTEVGQNIRTSLTQAVAEELHARPESIALVMADTRLTPFDMGTFGSRTTPTMAPQLHKVAAAAREMLLDLAAAKWNVDKKSLTVADGRVLAASGESAAFGELTRGQQLTQTIAADAPVTPPADWKVAGRDLTKIDARAMVTGQHRFTRDVRRPGMLHGRVLRAPAFQAKLKSVDIKAAEQIPGVTVVHDGDFIGVASADTGTLARAVESVRAAWETRPQPASRDLFEYLKGHPESRGTAPAQVISNAVEPMLESSYTVAYIAHVPLETRAAVAEWDQDQLTVWTGTQRPFGVRDELAQAFAMQQDRVRVIVPDTGSAYGGKHTGEAAIEAARLAKAAGKPVQVNWTREEEFTWAYFRPAGLIEVRSAANRDGAITRWEFHNYNSGNSGLRSPYHIPDQHAEFHATESPLRQGSYRGLAATANHFARESHMDELAYAIGMEPLAFRLKNAADPRLRAVIEAAAERFGWGKAKTRPGQGFGMSAGFEKGGYVACCAEITAIPGPDRLRVERVVEAFECGAVVNPEHLKNQIEGGVMMGIGGALFEAIDFENGRILNPRLSKYRVPRFSDAPAIESVLVDRKDLPSAGAGETPIVGIAPALANALFDATGRRNRSMPLRLG